MTRAQKRTHSIQTPPPATARPVTPPPRAQLVVIAVHSLGLLHSLLHLMMDPLRHLPRSRPYQQTVMCGLYQGRTEMHL
jgi:hypothetical protein